MQQIGSEADASSLADAELAQRTSSKVGWRLVPLAALLYLLAYLDRVNVGFAALTMNEDLQLSATAYGAAAGIFSLSYVVCGVPSNILLQRVGARRWIVGIVITWGLIAAAMAFARGAVSLCILRFLLGIAEAGLLPGLLFYLSQWLPRGRRTQIMGGFFISLPVAFIVGAPISTALLGIHWFGLRGWQWMFLLEGVLTSLIGLAVLVLLTERPENARWLRDDERQWLVHALRTEKAEGARAAAVDFRRGLLSPRVWLLGAMYFGIISASGCFGFWMPLIIKSIGGLTNFQVGLLTAAPYVICMGTILGWSRHSAAHNELTWHIVAPMLLAAIAFVFGALTHDPWLRMYLLFATVVLVYMVPTLFWELATRSLHGPAAAAGFALINGIASTGTYFGPQLMGYLKDVTNSYGPGLLVLAALLFATSALALRLGRSLEACHATTAV